MQSMKYEVGSQKYEVRGKKSEGKTQKAKGKIFDMNIEILWGNFY